MRPMPVSTPIAATDRTGEPVEAHVVGQACGVTTSEELRAGRHDREATADALARRAIARPHRG